MVKPYNEFVLLYKVHDNCNSGECIFKDFTERKADSFISIVNWGYGFEICSSKFSHGKFICSAHWGEYNN